MLLDLLLWDKYRIYIVCIFDLIFWIIIFCWFCILLLVSLSLLLLVFFFFGFDLFTLLSLIVKLYRFVEKLLISFFKKFVIEFSRLLVSELKVYVKFMLLKWFKKILSCFFFYFLKLYFCKNLNLNWLF